ncbi:MAG: hypothetical protein SOR75_00570 [Synergistes jonesii]|uniref:type II toxin-antitoxin system HicB family antitoxin n=1 Tax=Synergistes jonesii TaxID=2754 RepID=UPI002A764288|nr:hypothetical protein [Synergistes jonesii]MDY2983808.1 hypothetical protein [Synergistes jonesii]
MTEKYVYPLVLYREPRDGGDIWIGNFPGLNGCWAEAPSRGKVLHSAPLVLHEYASACRELKWPLPEAPSVDELKEANVGEVFLIEESQ